MCHTDSCSESSINADKDEWQVWGPTVGSEIHYPTLRPTHDRPDNTTVPPPNIFLPHMPPPQENETGRIETSAPVASNPSPNGHIHGWFPLPPIPGFQVYPEANISPAMSPTGPHPVAYPHPNLSFRHDGQISSSLDTRIFHLGMGSSHFQLGPFPPSFPPMPVNLNLPLPDYGSYYLTPPPEPLIDFSFTFCDQFSSVPSPIAHNLVPFQPYPLLSNSAISDSHSNHIPPPHLYPTGAPGTHFVPQGHNQPHHSWTSQPMTHSLSNVTRTKGISSPFNEGFGNQKFLDAGHVNPQNVPRSLLTTTPSSAVVFSGPEAKRPSPMTHMLVSSVHRGNRKSRRPYLFTDCTTLMSDFRKNREKHWEFSEILGHVVEFSNDQHGSRFIQGKLETITDEQKQRAFEEIHPKHTEELIQNVFGNYVIQKFLDHGMMGQKDAIADVVIRRALDFSIHIYGCRVVQKLIDYVPESGHKIIIQLLEKDILTCIKNPHGNHVIQKIIQVVNPNLLTFLPSISENILDLATHSYGCRVLQRCLEYISPEYLEGLLESIHRHTIELMQDQYGNYVIQFIIEQGRAKDRNIVISKIIKNLVALSHHKYASNVCEKALVHTDSDGRHKLIQEIMTMAPDFDNTIVKMMNDHALYFWWKAINEKLYSLELNLSSLHYGKQPLRILSGKDRFYQSNG
uniref:PUM-HD domain-containing protein n=1 Tax=Psilocybe cubensis TaxID=181762 RepID=A0A8H7Y3B3_PSICU